MKFSVIFYSAIVIVGIVVSIAVLRVLQAYISDLGKAIASLPNPSKYCTSDYNCRQNPKNCDDCINIFSAGLEPEACRSHPVRCICEKSQCIKRLYGELGG